MPVRVKLEDPATVDDDDDDDDMHIDNDNTNNVKNNTSVSLDDDENEEEDEIVREMDVFLSPELVHQLYLLQFPLQHFAAPSPSFRRPQPPSQAQAPPVAARIKPQHNILELDHAIPTDCIEQQGGKHLIQRTFASHTVPVTTHLAFGKVVAAADNDNDKSTTKLALHLAPLVHITQMRPTFSHIDQEDAEDLEHAAALEAEEQPSQAHTSADQNKQQERKPLMFQKKESERAAMARKSSYAYKKSSEEGEEWIDLRVIDGDDDYDNNHDFFDNDDDQDIKAQVAELRQQILCPEEFRTQYVLDAAHKDGADEKDVSTLNATTKSMSSLASYIRSLDYLPSAVSTYDRAAISATSASDRNNADPTGEDARSKFLVDWKESDNNTLTLDLPTIGAHLTTILAGGWPIPFSILKQTLPPTVPEQDLLTALTSCAVLVRGNYVLQSRLLPQLPKSVAKARTFILLLLQLMGVVHRSRLDRVFGISSGQDDDDDADDDDNFLHDEYLTPEAILILLEQVAQLSQSGWVLKVEDDFDFVQKFPENASIYMEYWGRQMLRFQGRLQRYVTVG